MRRITSCASAAAMIWALSLPASAQEATTDPPAHIAVVEGTASLERDGQPEAAPTSMPLLAGDRLRTANGRIEVLFADGATLHLDSSSTLDFQSDDVLRLMEGRLRLTIPGPRRRLSYRIDAPAGWVQIDEPGEYRIAITRNGPEPGVELVVLRGTAELLNEDGRTSLRAGERALARAGAAPSDPYVHNSAAMDAFDRWSEDRRGDRAGASAQYLPETVRAYSSTFDRDGDWRYDNAYGYVWYPTVSVGWRPYFNGRWTNFRSYGWTWIGSDRWAWPTHHYGRWGVSAGVWFWIPGRTWGPAWVSWAYAPGYVSWCPLGWDNRAVLQFGRAGYDRRRYDPWTAWTVVPHQRFGSGYVNTSFVGGSRIDGRTRDAFVVRTAAPEPRGYATSRGAAPIRGAGSRGGAAISSRDDGRFGGQGSGASTRGRSVVGDGAGATRNGVADDAAAVFRSRRPSASSPSGPGYPAPSRAPRTGSDVVDRMGATARPNGARTTDVTGVPVYRGSAPRQAERPAAPGRSGEEADRRADQATYRRTPSGAQPATAASSPPQRSWSAGERQVPSARSVDPANVPVYRAGRLGTDRQQPSDASRSGRVGAERQQPSDLYRAAPRQAPAAAAPPPPRSYGGAERRAPSGPPPSAAPPRQPGPPPSAGAPRGEEQSRSRPSGGEGNQRGSAVRRGRG